MDRVNVHPSNGTGTDTGRRKCTFQFLLSTRDTILLSRAFGNKQIE